MDSIEAEENIYAVSDAKLHGAMCKSLSIIVYKILGILPLLEDARPGRTSGLQALCSLYVAIDKAKSTLQHCSECSKLYLAITADFVLTKFGKVRCALDESLRRIEDMVPQDIGSQIMEIVGELEVTVFTVDQSEKQVGDELIALLQKEKRLNSTSNDEEELEIFRQAAIKLGITSSRAALTERRALKRLIERARAEQDERKESAVAYLLHLMRKYSKLLRNEMNDIDSQCSTPCSPLLLGSIEEARGNVQLVERQISKFGSMKFGQNGVEPGNTLVPPEQLRCPISMHLMYDPVIISSGQTYERVCIEKWFRDGHNTCPKTRQQLSHLGLTPNYCIKGLIVDWCEQNGVPAPDAPPESLDLNYWRLALSVRETSFSRLMGSLSLSQTRGTLVVPIEESDDVEKLKAAQSAATSDNGTCKLDEMGKVEKYENLMDALAEGKTVEDQRKTVEQIRFLLRDDEDARIYMGTDGFVAALVQFLRSTMEEGDEQAQETAAMALFNLAVNNNKNKEKFLAAGLISLLEQMIKEPTMHEASAALYLNLSCLDEAKPIIGSSKAVPFLFQLLQSGSCKKTCKHDALFTVYNLSTHPANIDALLHGGIISCLHAFLTVPTGSVCNNIWSEKALAILMNLAACPSGKSEIVSTDGLISAIANILESGEPLEQEQAASCFLSICEADDNCSQMVLQEGVIPALVCMSINGTSKGRERAHRLLTLFREQRQRDSQPVQEQLQQLHRIASEFVASGDGGGGGGSAPNAKPLSKARSRRLGRALSSMWKIRNTMRHFR